MNRIDFDKVVQYCAERASIFTLYEKLHGKRSIYGGQKQENVSCPWHGYRGDIRGSATLYPDSNCFYCHACSNKPLHVVDFVGKYLNKSFFESIFWLQREFGFTIPKEILDFTETEDKIYNKDNFQKELRSFEKTLIQKKIFFSFEQYKKIFHLIDVIIHQFEYDEEHLRKYFDQFTQLKDKINKSIRHKLEKIYGEKEGN